MGHARWVVGDLAEELTHRLVGGVRHKTDSRAWYCPDVSVGEDYYESKAVGRSRTAFVYGGRLEKDREFVVGGRELHYVIWHHSASVIGVATVEQLRAVILDSLVARYVVPFAEVDRICRTRRLDKLNSAYGGPDKKTYGTGYRIPLALLERWRELPC